MLIDFFLRYILIKCGVTHLTVRLVKLNLKFGTFVQHIPIVRFNKLLTLYLQYKGLHLQMIIATHSSYTNKKKKNLLACRQKRWRCGTCTGCVADECQVCSGVPRQTQVWQTWKEEAMPCKEKVPRYTTIEL